MTVTVIVRDSAAQPVSAAIISLEGHTAPQVRTNEDGRAAFAAVAAGRYRVRIIRVGYQPIGRQMDVGASDTTIVLVMQPTLARLAEVQVIASRPTGVFGKVGRASDWAPVSDATVVVFGGRTMRTDSTGSFEAPEVRSGAHLVRVSRAGFIGQMRSVTVPPSGAVEVAFLLDTGRTPANVQRVLVELNQRQRWRGNDSAVIPREELIRFGGGSLAAALRGAPSVVRKGLVFTGSACIFVDGEPKPGWSLDAFGAEEIEAVEVYAGRAEMSNTLRSRWPRGIPCGTGSSPTTGPRRPGSVSMVVIWLKPKAPR